MAAVGMNPAMSQYTFGSITTGSKAASIKGLQNTQTIDLGMLSQLNNQSGPSGGINESNKGEYLALFEGMQSGQETQGSGQNFLQKGYNSLVNMFVRRSLS